MMNIDFTKEEVEDLLRSLVHCESRGYFNHEDPAYSAMEKLEKYYRETIENENDICIF